MSGCADTRPLAGTPGATVLQVALAVSSRPVSLGPCREVVRRSGHLMPSGSVRDAERKRSYRARRAAELGDPLRLREELRAVRAELRAAEARAAKAERAVERFAERVKRLRSELRRLAVDRRRRGTVPAEVDTAELAELRGLVDELRAALATERARTALTGKGPAVGNRAERRKAGRCGKR